MEIYKIKELVKKTILKTFIEDDKDLNNDIDSKIIAKRYTIIYGKVVGLCDNNTFLAEQIMDEVLKDVFKIDENKFAFQMMLEEINNR